MCFLRKVILESISKVVIISALQPGDPVTHVLNEDMTVPCLQKMLLRPQVPSLQAWSWMPPSLLCRVTKAGPHLGDAGPRQPCLQGFLATLPICQQSSELTFQPGSKARAKGQSLPSSHGQACITAAHPAPLLPVNPFFLASASRRKHGTHLLKFYCGNCPTYHEIALTAGGPELWLSVLILAMSPATLHLSPAPLAPGLGSTQHQDLGSWEFPSRLSGYASDEYP